jgi:hypothetical protein
MEKRENHKEIIRSRNSKCRQYNGKERKDKVSLFSIVLSVLRITASDYLFIFSLFSIVLSVLRIAASHYLFIFSLFFIVLSVLRITASDYLFIFSLFSIVLSVLRITASDYLFIFFYFFILSDNAMEKREKTKGVMRSRNSKYRQ